MSSKKRFLPPALLAALALIWGSSFILIKKGLIVFSADEVAMLRVVAAFFFLLPFTLTRLKGLTLNNHIKLFVCGLIGIFIPSFLFALAQTQMDSAMVGIINSLTPIWAIIMSVVVYAKWVTKYAVIGTLVGFGGVFLLIMTSAKSPLDTFNPYALLLVGATFLYGYNLNFVKYSIKNIDALTITSVSTLVIGIVATIYLFGFTSFTVKLTTQEGALKAFGFVVALGLMSTAVAVVILNHLIKLSSPLYASFSTYYVPIVAIMLGILDGELLSGEAYLGMAAILGGVYLVNKK